LEVLYEFIAFLCPENTATYSPIIFLNPPSSKSFFFLFLTVPRLGQNISEAIFLERLSALACNTSLQD
tara:strand:+ start:1217 stop:1420 length:204 start_codon:yes stop_codon:yes gene_type:complete